MEDTFLMLPELRHPEIFALFQHDLDIPMEKLDAILALPRETVVEDLEKIVRFGIEKIEAEDENLTEDNNFFVFHALMVLGHLRSEESLPLVLDVFRLTGDDHDFLFGDMFLEDFFQVPLFCGLGQIEVLADFVKDPTVEHEFARVNVVSALAAMANRFPEKRGRILEQYTQLLHHFLEIPDDDFSDDEYYACTSVASAVSENKFAELLPLVEPLFKNERIDLMWNGDWENYQKTFGEVGGAERTLYFDARDWYKIEGKKWLERMEENRKAEERRKIEAARKKEEAEKKQEEAEQLKKLKQTQLEKTGKTEIGRNDPCPCGSGKKFKRCHGA